MARREQEEADANMEVAKKAFGAADRSKSRGKNNSARGEPLSEAKTQQTFNLSFVKPAKQNSTASPIESDKEALTKRRAQELAALRAEESFENSQEEMRLSKASAIAKQH